ARSTPINTGSTSRRSTSGPGATSTVSTTPSTERGQRPKHHLVDTPLIMVGRMRSELVQWARASMLDSRLHLVNPEDLSIPRCVVTGDEAIALIREHHARWLHARERHERRPER